MCVDDRFLEETGHVKRLLNRRYVYPLTSNPWLKVYAAEILKTAIRIHATRSPVR